MNEFMGNMQRQGISPEMYFQLTGTTEEDLHKQYEADADKRVKTNLVIELSLKQKDSKLLTKKSKKKSTTLLQNTTWKLNKFVTFFQQICLNTISL